MRSPSTPPVPPFDEFWEDGGVDLPQVPYDDAVFSEFRADPDANPLQTPSGKIEIYSETFASFGQPDVPPHASWLEPVNWWGSPLAEEYDLHLLCNQPSHRLHSQQDMGQGEPVRQGPQDASRSGCTPTTPPPAG